MAEKKRGAGMNTRQIMHDFARSGALERRVNCKGAYASPYSAANALRVAAERLGLEGRVSVRAEVETDSVLLIKEPGKPDNPAGARNCVLPEAVQDCTRDCEGCGNDILIHNERMARIRRGDLERVGPKKLKTLVLPKKQTEESKEITEV